MQWLHNFNLDNLPARLAQSVERGTFNPEVKGSSPLSGEYFRFRCYTQDIKYFKLNMISVIWFLKQLVFLKVLPTRLQITVPNCSTTWV